MAIANLILPNGTKVNIEGTPDEVADLISRCTSAQEKSSLGAGVNRRPKRIPSLSKVPKARRSGPQTFIEQLAEEQFFKTKKTIGEIQDKLEEAGHIYALHSLSTPLLRLTRGKRLRRIKEKLGWVYVNY